MLSDLFTCRESAGSSLAVPFLTESSFYVLYRTNKELICVQRCSINLSDGIDPAEVVSRAGVNRAGFNRAGVRRPRAGFIWGSGPGCRLPWRARTRGSARGLCGNRGRCRLGHRLCAGSQLQGGGAKTYRLGPPGLSRHGNRAAQRHGPRRAWPRSRPHHSRARAECHRCSARCGRSRPVQRRRCPADRALGHAAGARPDGQPQVDAGDGQVRRYGVHAACVSVPLAERGSHAMARTPASVRGIGRQCAGLSGFFSHPAAQSLRRGAQRMACGVEP